MINKPKKLIGIATYAHWIVNKPRILNIIIILAKLHLSIENRSIKDFRPVFSTFATQLEYEAKSTTQFKLHRLILWSLLYYFLYLYFELVEWFELRVKKSILRQVFPAGVVWRRQKCILGDIALDSLWNHAHLLNELQSAFINLYRMNGGLSNFVLIKKIPSYTWFFNILSYNKKFNLVWVSFHLIEILELMLYCIRPCLSCFLSSQDKNF